MSVSNVHIGASSGVAEIDWTQSQSGTTVSISVDGVVKKSFIDYPGNNSMPLWLLLGLAPNTNPPNNHTICVE